MAANREITPMRSRGSLPTEREIDELISTRFTVSLMSDSKWKRLIGGLTDAFEDGIHVNFKLVHSDDIHHAAFLAPDFGAFFVEPLLYREIEWIEFPDSYEDFVNPDNRKAGKRFYEQDLSGLLIEIRRIGEFDIERFPSALRIRGYR